MCTHVYYNVPNVLYYTCIPLSLIIINNNIDSLLISIFRYCPRAFFRWPKIWASIIFYLCILYMYNNSRLRSSSGRGNHCALRPTPQPIGLVFTLARVRIRQRWSCSRSSKSATILLDWVLFGSSIPVRVRYEHGPSTTRDRKFFVFFFLQ